MNQNKGLEFVTKNRWTRTVVPLRIHSQRCEHPKEQFWCAMISRNWPIIPPLFVMVKTCLVTIIMTVLLSAFSVVFFSSPLSCLPGCCGLKRAASTKWNKLFPHPYYLRWMRYSESPQQKGDGDYGVGWSGQFCFRYFVCNTRSVRSSLQVQSWNLNLVSWLIFACSREERPLWSFRCSVVVVCSVTSVWCNSDIIPVSSSVNAFQINEVLLVLISIMTCLLQSELVEMS
jgi:hypothetical protein